MPAAPRRLPREPRSSGVNLKGVSFCRISKLYICSFFFRKNSVSSKNARVFLLASSVAFIQSPSGPPTSASRVLPHCKNSVFNCDMFCDSVGTVFRNSSFSSSPNSRNALSITSEVMRPCSARAINSSRGTFMLLAMVRITSGSCSDTERNSSPRSTPRARACDNCRRAFVASTVPAPEMITAWFSAFWTVSRSSTLVPASFVANVKRWNS